jgi:hypothetical protein
MAQRSRLPEVTQPLVPFRKQTARAQLRTTAAAGLPVAWRIISVTGAPVLVCKIVSTSTILNNMTKIKTIPVVPPMPTAATIAWGASRCGIFISSVICAT